MLKKLFNRILKKIIGELKYARRKGLNADQSVIIIGGVSFGTEPYLITLKKNVKISNSVQFITHDGGTWTIRKDGGCHSLVKYGRIVVDENTFIGAHSIILPNVYIGKNVVVGAGSVVTKSIPDNCVVAGVPAKVIMSINEYKMKSLSKMPSDWSDEQYFKNKRSYLEKRIPYPPKVDNQ